MKDVGLMVLGNSNVMIGQTFLLAIFKGQNNKFLLLQRVFLGGSKFASILMKIF